jgi:hypothetical protein
LVKVALAMQATPVMLELTRVREVAAVLVGVLNPLLDGVPQAVTAVIVLPVAMVVLLTTVVLQIPETQEIQVQEATLAVQAVQAPLLQQYL